MPARRSSSERPSAPALVVSPEEALDGVDRQLGEGSELLSTTVVTDGQQLEAFKSRFERWRDMTAERLRRMFDQEEYADTFFNSALPPKIFSYRESPQQVFELYHVCLRQSFGKLETYRDLIRDGVVGPAPPQAAQVTASSQSRFRDVHIHVAGGAIGQLNAAASVQNIESHINALAGPNAEAAAEAFKELIEAVAQDTELGDDTRREVIENLEDLVEQADRPPEERRSGRIKAALASIPTALRTANLAYETWTRWGPTLEDLFHHH